MKALLLLILSGILAAGVFLAGKQAGAEPLSPLLILFWQMSGGALVVWTVSWPSRQFPVWDAQHLRYYLIGGLLGVSLPYVLAFIVLRELQVGLVGLMTALSPIMTYAMARLLVINLLLGNFPALGSTSPETGLLLAGLGALAGASYLSSFNLLRVGGPVYLSQMGYVITAVTLLAGILFWDERYERHDLLSMALILTGVLLTTWVQGAQRQPIARTST
jgi:drug/metabolite transporter (DMT)-like permease